MSPLDSLNSTVSEYRSLTSIGSRKNPDLVDRARIVRELSRNHDWTTEGARTIVELADSYGAFVLRNALALAVALEKEDGDLHF